MFNKLYTCEVRFYIGVWSLSKCYKNVWFHWKLSSNQRKTNRFPAKLLGKLSQNRQFFTNRFLTETGLENSCEIGRFFREFVPENPAKFDVFFRDLPEALRIWEKC